MASSENLRTILVSAALVAGLPAAIIASRLIVG